MPDAVGGRRRRAPASVAQFSLTPRTHDPRERRLKRGGVGGILWIGGGLVVLVLALVCHAGIENLPLGVAIAASLIAIIWGGLSLRGLEWVNGPDERAERLRRSQALIGLLALGRAIDAKDPATREHSERVAALAEELARIVGWDDARALALREAALVHDVGKIGIDDAILRKPTRLTPAERDHVNSHAEISGRIVDGVLAAEQVEWIRTHHERVDGSGYPAGLNGAQIPLGGALLAIADAFDAMTAERCYSAPRDPADALAECRTQIGRHFSQDAVAALEVWLLSGGAEAWVSEAPVATESLVSGHGPGHEH